MTPGGSIYGCDPDPVARRSPPRATAIQTRDGFFFFPPPRELLWPLLFSEPSFARAMSHDGNSFRDSIRCSSRPYLRHRDASKVPVDTMTPSTHVRETAHVAFVSSPPSNLRNIDNRSRLTLILPRPSPFEVFRIGRRNTVRERSA